MKRDPAALSRATFDLLIIGGGIIGAGTARDAAMRGLSVALVEKGDFASGTSSRSSKLIHGGFRYLEQYDFALVAESCGERRVLQRIAPDRVRPLKFLLPVYEGDPRPLWKMRLGMTLYDLLALYRNTAPHRTLGPDAALAAEPNLNPEGLRGAIVYYDCQEDDARFCLDNILHAGDLGATCVNYCEATGVARGDSGLARVQLTDRLTGSPFEASARALINAAGPWVEQVQRFAAPSGNGVTLSPTKGVHLLLPRVTSSHAVCFQAKRDGRIMFLLPWHDCCLIGTTDTDFRGDPGQVRSDPADATYLLEELSRIAPNAGLGAADVITAFAGVRALIGSGAANPSSRSREHAIVREGENLLTVAGGKYTTYRLIAREAVDRIYEMIGRKPPPCLTGRTPLPRHETAAAGVELAPAPLVYESDIIRACRDECATSVSDVMYRRTGLALSRFGGSEVAERVAAIAARELDWTASQARESLAEYLRERSPDVPKS